MIWTRRAQPGLAASEGPRVCPPARARFRLRSRRLSPPALRPWQPAFGQAQTDLEQLVKPPKIESAEPMLLQADEMIYDNENNAITAKGNVEIYYGNYTLLAERVIYDRGPTRSRPRAMSASRIPTARSSPPTR